MKDFLLKEWSISEKSLLITTILLTGVIIGFLTAPIKKGIYCGNHNGNTQFHENQDE